jgi:hypothetical protein
MSTIDLTFTPERVEWYSRGCLVATWHLGQWDDEMHRTVPAAAPAAVDEIHTIGTIGTTHRVRMVSKRQRDDRADPASAA